MPALLIVVHVGQVTAKRLLGNRCLTKQCTHRVAKVSLRVAFEMIARVTARSLYSHSVIQILYVVHRVKSLRHDLIPLFLLRFSLLLLGPCAPC